MPVANPVEKNIITVNLECPVYESFRVRQVAGMFDVPIAEKMREQFSVEVPGRDNKWSIGAIVGPSGSGKSSVARQAFGNQLYQGHEWRKDCAVIDAFGNATIDHAGDTKTKEITQALTAVGFSSPPSWVKPYHVLSNGEQFRCNLARCLLFGGPLVAYDEFTSVVDRTVAKVGSAAVAKAIRKREDGFQFVAVTCHYDVLEWLEPDWILDMATGETKWRSLRRPEIKLEIYACDRSAWGMFKRHHYLTSALPTSAKGYIAVYEGQPVAYAAVMAHFGSQGRGPKIYRMARLVVLPDWQGIGIGTRMLNAVADIYKKTGVRVLGTTANTGVVAAWRKSPLWVITGKQMIQKVPGGETRGWEKSRSAGRLTVSAEYVGVGKSPICLSPETDQSRKASLAPTQTSPSNQHRSKLPADLAEPTGGNQSTPQRTKLPREANGKATKPRTARSKSQ